MRNRQQLQAGGQTRARSCQTPGQASLEPTTLQLAGRGSVGRPNSGLPCLWGGESLFWEGL